MTKATIFARLLFISALAVGQGAWAQASQSSPLSAKLEASKIVKVDGRVEHSSAAAAKPGDVVEYAATYANSGSDSVSAIQATIPVPVGTTLVVGSVSPANAQATVDGATYGPMPLKHIVRTADGKSHEELVPLEDYRALRWTISSVPAKKDAVVRLNVQVNKPAPLAVATSATVVSAVSAPAAK